MIDDLIQKYDSRVPRYTSYPTAPHFHEGIGGEAYRHWLNELDTASPVSLYLHVPFCDEMCWYCGCYTKVVRRYSPIADYARLLEREADMLAEALPAKMTVSHQHWGGGTPTMLSAEDFRAISARLRRHFDYAPDSEIAVEIDPRTLTEAHVAAMADSGVNRASLGVQDFDPAIQRAINRVQPLEVTARALSWLRGAGIDAVNFDLMYGLPGQKLEHVLKSVDISVSLEPDRIALFGYAHVPWMKSHQKMIDESALAGAAERLAQAEAAAERLMKRGYRRIGLDHFARPEDEMSRRLEAGSLNRNFQGYTTDDAPALLGLGASAIGSLPQGYVQNVPAMKAYREAVEAGAFPIARGLAYEGEDIMRRDLIQTLMCDLKIDLAEAARAHGLPEGYFDGELERARPMVGDGLAAIEGRMIRVTEKGRPFVRALCALFDEYLGSGAGRHSKAI